MWKQWNVKLQDNDFRGLKNGALSNFGGRAVSGPERTLAWLTDQISDFCFGRTQRKLDSLLSMAFVPLLGLESTPIPYWLNRAVQHPFGRSIRGFRILLDQ